MNRRGFAPIVVLGIVAAIIIIGAIGYFTFKNLPNQRSSRSIGRNFQKQAVSTTQTSNIPTPTSTQVSQSGPLSARATSTQNICGAVAHSIPSSNNPSQSSLPGSFNNSYQISLTIDASSGNVRLSLYNSLGQQVSWPDDTDRFIETHSIQAGTYCLVVMGEASTTFKVNVGTGGKYISGTTNPGLTSTFQIKINPPPDASLSISLISDGGASITVSNVELSNPNLSQGLTRGDNELVLGPLSSRTLIAGQTYKISWNSQLGHDVLIYLEGLNTPNALGFPDSGQDSQILPKSQYDSNFSPYFGGAYLIADVTSTAGEGSFEWTIPADLPNRFVSQPISYTLVIATMDWGVNSGPMGDWGGALGLSWNGPLYFATSTNL